MFKEDKEGKERMICNYYPEDLDIYMKIGYY